MIQRILLVLLLMCAALLTNCIHRGSAIEFTVIKPGQGVRSNGGNAIINDFSVANVEREATEVKLFYDRCQKQADSCGTYMEFHYDDRITQSTLENAIATTVAAFNYAQPIYVRVHYDDHPRDVPLYADISIGQVILLP